MPSNLQSRRFGRGCQTRHYVVGPVTRERLWRCWRYYAALCAIAIISQLWTIDPRVSAFALGLVVPGGGFIVWALGDSANILLAGLFGLAAIALFVASLILWFGTGNVIVAPTVWLGAALVSANPSIFDMVLLLGVQREQLVLLSSTGLVFATLAILVWFLRSQNVREVLSYAHEEAQTASHPSKYPDEISLADLKKLRLLLDRALQPVDQFEGFEWRDQFQTAAIRYQINFISYAIALAQHHFVPAATSYLTEAQDKLLAKQGDEKVWGYWKFENAWGNLRVNQDPVPDQNIMYSGFIAAQMAYSQCAQTKSELRLSHDNKPFRCYDFDQLAKVLLTQYRSSKFGLLACEPNWIYPLCNLITATALRAHSARCDTKDWDAIAPRFRESLLSEFTQANGQFVPFRSSLTGIAPPALGGAVMQAFPVFFLNSLFPDLAQHHWRRLRKDLQTRDWKRCFWPIDVGNYGFSRASSYAASAAAAVEMGDLEIATQLLELLDQECPTQDVGGFPHRQKASLWAHSLEMVARLGRHNGLAQITSGPPLAPQAGPHIEITNYDDVMIASSKRQGTDGLGFVVYPVQPSCVTEISLAGLAPFHRYQANGEQAQTFTADGTGRAVLQVWLTNRTQFDIQKCE